MPSHPMSPASCSASAARQASRRGALLALSTMAWSVCTLAAEAPAEPPKGAEIGRAPV